MQRSTKADAQYLAEVTATMARYKNALEEIRDTASISEGVEFYAFLADKALNPNEYINQKMGGKKS
jgi:hypothetical protein|tara:strand:+ start:10220 stop:10417 length:198 start_codon:yes stop_codon:yes gene_type:complete